ncbi:hypothetical protein GWI33_006580 [Rhynchophorus ferrugineus]|uniref:Uncharacterized protein n=1 Tax=Rhynchophorus ferrugineus TaxID=354439 RepID=A0A834IFV4_RHYFE|nr:hypothetical protein GWI33_006580 [Rhynchophorus ferrugineus]
MPFPGARSAVLTDLPSRNFKFLSGVPFGVLLPLTPSRCVVVSLEIAPDFLIPTVSCRLHIYFSCSCPLAAVSLSGFYRLEFSRLNYLGWCAAAIPRRRDAGPDSPTTSYS